MRVAIVTESFLPSINGVTTSVCRVAECLHLLGHDVVVIAPDPAPAWFGPIPVHTVRSVPVRQFPTGVPSGRVESLLAEIAPDVVHVASPFVIGARALSACHELGLPSVAIFQTDMPRYAEQHAPGPLAPQVANLAWRWVRRVHALADQTLAPSTSSLAALRAHGVERIALWGRGVDTTLFSPAWRNHPAARDLRARLAPAGETLVGYIGRLAPEKELDRLAELAGIPGLRLVIVGDGPSRAALETTLNRAFGCGARPAFLGFRQGADLAIGYAALDVFVHPGTTETFGQTLQEAAASGLPVVAAAVGGPLDLVEHGRIGLLFDPALSGALSACVGHLVSERAVRERMGAAATAAVAERTWPSLTATLVEHYAHARRRMAPERHAASRR
ncbi:MAG TPA: glycosyltransferase family 1 protein [Tetrasphaera sp.]|uniref:glycosyltransferase family 4 protein n=1 Tax=Nostocoides sp. TaxID=1917966 RepID=UPI002B5917CC|nr:glycosyltransferase family 1 protein [Tetrasphaera sp.]HNQ06766.1 glycosyltransferase family 1 protein [Tetrasphaera sp.]